MISDAGEWIGPGKSQRSLVMRVCLFEDRAEFLEPLSLTRPVFDLWCGLTTLGRKLWHYFGPTSRGVLVRPHLANLYREQHPQLPVNDWHWLRAEALVLVNGRWLPPDQPWEIDQEPCLGLVGDELVYALLGRDQVRELTPESFESNLETWKRTLPCRAAGGQFIAFPWDLVQHNAEEIQRDFAGPAGKALMQPIIPPLALVGPVNRLRIDPTARIDPYVVADTTKGPVVIDHRAILAAFTRLEGPCYVGPYTQVQGANIRAGTTLGPHCRIGGEVEASIVQGYSNKVHEGFLGHSYLGEWVNLGAGTHNSDLRNDYGPVSVTVQRQLLPTGQTKVGCFLGDHTKTGLGTLLNTGASVGAFCNLLPAGRLAPKYVPSFMNWWNGSLGDGFPLETLLNTATQVMQRRGCSLTEAHSQLYRFLWEESALERRRVLRDGEQRTLRRSA
jgi:UDP-N-acetylglucosamine diphosphorylase/glucosamine-1-phosphate N-acetyltransferase